MSDEIIKREGNFRTVGAAVTQDTAKDISMLRVDPVTKYLLVSVAADTTGSQTASQIASRDGNFRPVCLGWDETNGVLQEILTDSSGNLLCDVTLI